MSLIVLTLLLTASAAEPAAVIELYTSEGCNSCPPAESLLATLRDLKQNKGMPLHTVAFHVDYWDRLGWKDPWGSAEWTRRQRAFASMLGRDGLYTPQVIVNGVEEGVGSNADLVSKMVATALDKPLPVTVHGAARWEGVELVVEVKLEDAPAGAILELLLVEEGISNHIRGGENAGLKIDHPSVARSQQQVDPGIHRIRPPKDAVRGNLLVLAVVRHPQTVQVLGVMALKPS